MHTFGKVDLQLTIYPSNIPFKHKYTNIYKDHYHTIFVGNIKNSKKTKQTKKTQKTMQMPINKRRIK